jgi:hypothetical protein
MARAREASDTFDLTTSSVDHIVNNGRDSVDGAGRRLHPHATTGDPACSVNVTLAEVWAQQAGFGNPWARSMRPHLVYVT